MGFSAAPSAPSSRKVYLWVLYCRVYSATALKHSLVGFLPRAPCGPADSIELVGQADVLCAVSLHHSILDREPRTGYDPSALRRSTRCLFTTSSPCAGPD